jgi:hypothetical protein
LPKLQDYVDQYSYFNAVSLKYSRRTGYYLEANREIAVGEPVFEIPCHYLITTFEEFEGRAEWYDLIISAEKQSSNFKYGPFFKQ